MNCVYLVFIFSIIILISVTNCSVDAIEDVNQNSITSDRTNDFKKSFEKNCADSYSLTCLKLHFVSWVDKLDEQDNISLIPGVNIVRENHNNNINKNDDIAAELAREFPDDPNARLDHFILKKINGFFVNHAIKLNFMNVENDASSGVFVGRKKDKKGDGLGMILALGAMMKGTLLALALGGLAALAGKALMTGLIALVLSAITGLKSLSHGGGGGSTYEVVAKPVYSTSHTHSVSHEGWDGGNSIHKRSLESVPLPLGLQPHYKPGE